MSYRYCTKCGDIEDSDQHLTPKQCKAKTGEECPNPEAHHRPKLVDSEEEFTGA